MIRYQIDHLPVLDNTRLKGVVTSFDIISRMVPRESRRKGELLPEYVKRFEHPVRSLIADDPLIFPPDTPSSKVLEIMLSKKVDYAVLAMGDELQGIVSYRDFLKPLVSSAKAPTRCTWSDCLKTLSRQKRQRTSS